MATVWITYAWADNQSRDVDYIAQELTDAGLTIRMDRWEIVAGKRLWDQIERYVCSPSECDAWIWFATQNSLGSEPCREEFAWALSRALSQRGDSFPLIALTQKPEDHDLLPAAVKVRRYVQLFDPDWKERVVAAAEGRALNINPSRLDPYIFKVHPKQADGSTLLEMRPRIGSWMPSVVAIPSQEEKQVFPKLTQPFLPVALGFNGQPDGIQCMHGVRSGTSAEWTYVVMNDEVTANRSVFLCVTGELPSRILFGSEKMQYTVDLSTAGIKVFDSN